MFNGFLFWIFNTFIRFTFSKKKWKTKYSSFFVFMKELLKQIKMNFMIIIKVYSIIYSRASSCQVHWGFPLRNCHVDTKNSLFRKQLIILMFILLAASFLFRNSRSSHRKGVLNFLILKAGLKYKQMPRKIKVKDFRLGSAARITPFIWNTFSCSNILFPLRRTYPR